MWPTTRPSGQGEGPASAWPPHQTFLGTCLHNWCNAIAACTDFFCCCWLIRGCFGGRIGPLSGPPDPPFPPPSGPGPAGARFESPYEPLAPPGPFGAPFGRPGPPGGQPGPSPF